MHSIETYFDKCFKVSILTAEDVKQLFEENIPFQKVGAICKAIKDV